MTLIQCPHCVEDIELEDGSSGLFDCPHCNGEFEWGVEQDQGQDEYEGPLMQWWKYSASGSAKVGIVINAIGLVVFIGLFLINGFETGPYGNLWMFIPMLIWVVGILVMFVPFLFFKVLGR